MSPARVLSCCLPVAAAVVLVALCPKEPPPRQTDPAKGEALMRAVMNEREQENIERFRNKEAPIPAGVPYWATTAPKASAEAR